MSAAIASTDRYMAPERNYQKFLWKQKSGKKQKK